MVRCVHVTSRRTKQYSNYDRNSKNCLCLVIRIYVYYIYIHTHVVLQYGIPVMTALEYKHSHVWTWPIFPAYTSGFPEHMEDQLHGTFPPCMGRLRGMYAAMGLDLMSKSLSLLGVVGLYVKLHTKVMALVSLWPLFTGWFLARARCSSVRIIRLPNGSVACSASNHLLV